MRTPIAIPAAAFADPNQHRVMKQIEANLNGLVISGTGSPQGVVTADPGQLYIDTNGGAGVTLYVKETGTGNTGWAAK
jgi:hypothetical protein